MTGRFLSRFLGSPKIRPASPSLSFPLSGAKRNHGTFRKFENPLGGGLLSAGATQQRLTGTSTASFFHAAGLRHSSTLNSLPLPEPITFESKPLKETGETFMVADLPGSGPFYLDAFQHSVLEQFAANESSRVLLFSGTIKSGKSTLLMTVLPGMIAAKQSTTKPRPVFLEYAMLADRNPDEALAGLNQAAQILAQRLGITTTVGITSPRVLIPHIAAELKQHGHELWILLDEFQGPLNACSLDDISHFSTAIKEIYEQSRRHGAHMAVTGSGMLSVLRSLQLASTSGMYLWGETTVLSRGQCVGPVVFKAMLDEMLPHFRKSPLLDKETILNIFKSEVADGLVNYRPAVLSYFLHLLSEEALAPGQDIGSAIHEVWQSQVIEKISSEVSVPTAHGLGLFSVEWRILLHYLGCGQLTHKVLKMCDQRLYSLVRSLLESQDKSDVAKLQPPYAKMLANWLGPDGSVGIVPLGKESIGLAYSPQAIHFLADLFKSQKITKTAIISIESENKINQELHNILFGEMTKYSHHTLDEIRATDIGHAVVNYLQHQSHSTFDFAVDKKTGRLIKALPASVEDIVSQAVYNFSDIHWGCEFLGLVQHQLSHQPATRFIGLPIGAHVIIHMAKVVEQVLLSQQPEVFYKDEIGLWCRDQIKKTKD